MFIPQSYGNFIGSDPSPILLEHTFRFTQQSVLATQEMPQDLPPKKGLLCRKEIWGYNEDMGIVYGIYIYIYIFIYFLIYIL